MLTRLSEWLRGTQPTQLDPKDTNDLKPIEDADPNNTALSLSLGQLAKKGLLAQALDDRNLLEAWERVRDNDGAPGIDGQDIQQFGHNVLGRLQLIKGEVLKGSYQPQPLKRFSIPKPDGKLRWLAIPSVRDRVLQTAVARVIRPKLEAEFEDASYGYRTGRSVAMAIARVERHRDSGQHHVVDADIEGFFDNIRHATLLKQLKRVISDEGIHAVVSLWLCAIVKEGKQSFLLTKGVPQGSPLSPLLANLYLDDFDEAILAKFPGLVRYADDFVVLTPSPEKAHEALELVKRSLADLKLTLNLRKTQITHFDQGFEFLGVRFHGRLTEAVNPEAEPWLLPKARDEAAAQRHEVTQALQAAARGIKVFPEDPDPTPLPSATQPSESNPLRHVSAYGDPSVEGDADIDEAHPILQLTAPETAAPLLQSLYVGQAGSWLMKEGGRVVVSKDRQVIASVPMGQLDQIAVVANAMISTALLRECAQQRIQLYVADPAGGGGISFDRGTLPEMHLFDAQRRLTRQEDLLVHIARSHVEGKLHNSKVILRRFSRREGREQIEDHIKQIDQSLRRLPAAKDCNTLRGLEGQAAKAYFAAMKCMLPGSLSFSGRRKRPPPDPTNALLSFGYAVLAANMHTLLKLAGLNVHIGTLHAAGPGSQALISDLIEEFRAPVVDAVVLTLLREKRLTLADFESDAGQELPCRLSTKARKEFVQALENKLQSRFIHPQHKTVMDIRRAMQAQVQHYIRVLLRDEPTYIPIKFK